MGSGIRALDCFAWSSSPFMTANNVTMLNRITFVARLRPRSSHHGFRLARHTPEVDLREGRVALTLASCSSEGAASCRASGRCADGGKSYTPYLAGSAAALQ